jgi:hypothetical protein
MIRQEITLSNGQKVALEIGKDKTIMEVVNIYQTKVCLALTLEDIEELTDLFMDSFYKAQQIQNQPGKEVSHG